MFIGNRIMISTLYLLLLIVIACFSLHTGYEWFRDYSLRNINVGHIFHHWSTLVLCLLLIISPAIWAWGYYKKSITGQIFYVILGICGLSYLVFWTYLASKPGLHIQNIFSLIAYLVSFSIPIIGFMLSRSNSN